MISPSTGLLLVGPSFPSKVLDPEIGLLASLPHNPARNSLHQTPATHRRKTTVASSHCVVTKTTDPASLGAGPFGQTHMSIRRVLGSEPAWVQWATAWPLLNYAGHTLRWRGKKLVPRHLLQPVDVIAYAMQSRSAVLALPSGTRWATQGKTNHLCKKKALLQKELLQSQFHAAKSTAKAQIRSTSLASSPGFHPRMPSTIPPKMPSELASVMCLAISGVREAWNLPTRGMPMNAHLIQGLLA